jgi:hypothetical protein
MVEDYLEKKFLIPAHAGFPNELLKELFIGKNYGQKG